MVLILRGWEDVAFGDGGAESSVRLGVVGRDGRRGAAA